MAFPQYVNHATTIESGNLTSHPITMPSFSVGDLLLVFFAIDGNPTITISGGTGWTLGTQASYSTTVTGVYVWKIAQGSDTLTLSTGATSERGTAIAYSISGTTSTPITTSAAATGSSINADPPSVTPPSGAMDYLWMVSSMHDGTVLVTVAPGDFGNLITANGGASTSANTGTARREFNTAIAYNPGVFTSATEQWVAFTICIKPGIAPITASIVESTTGTETESAIFTGLSAIIEALTGIDSPSAIATLLSFITEAISTIDASDGLIIGYVNIIETGTAIETTNGDIFSSAAITEGTSAIDISDRIYLLIASITEDISASDIQNNIFIGCVSIIESGSSNDITDSEITAEPGIISEEINVIDIQSAIFIGLTSISEGLTAIDQQSTDMPVLASIEEITEAMDFVTTMLYISCSISEGASAGGGLKYWSGSEWIETSIKVYT